MHWNHMHWHFRVRISAGSPVPYEALCLRKMGLFIGDGREAICVSRTGRAFVRCVARKRHFWAVPLDGLHLSLFECASLRQSLLLRVDLMPRPVEISRPLYFASLNWVALILARLAQFGRVVTWLELLVLRNAEKCLLYPLLAGCLLVQVYWHILKALLYSMMYSNSKAECVGNLWCWCFCTLGRCCLYRSVSNIYLQRIKKDLQILLQRRMNHVLKSKLSLQHKGQLWISVLCFL